MVKRRTDRRAPARHARFVARLLSRALLVALVTLAAGCATRSVQPPIQEGIASWYGPGFHGQRTASGETYNQHGMTAAHRTWPLGTRVRVTNLENGRQVTVRINDRGPFVDDRILDLSYAAARKLGMVESGTCSVRVEPLDHEDGEIGTVAFAVQVAAFADRARADAYRRDLASLKELEGGSLRQPRENVYVASGGDRSRPVYRVRVGPYAQREEAQLLAASLEERGLPAIVVEEVVRR
ncbi:MAG TPA: septal ring lytic transglycosylase RlpA family protein [Candidatus Binatia bacterium]